jgi:hypothetical protein
MHFSLPTHFRKPRLKIVETKTILEEAIEVAAIEPVETAARKTPRKRVKKVAE